MNGPAPMTTLVLLRHGTTGETSGVRFPAASGADPGRPGVELDADGAAVVRALRAHVPAPDVVWSSHAARAVQSATLVARDPDLRDGDLAESGFGRWAGSAIAQVEAVDPAALAAWMRDPAPGPPGGEPFAAVQARAAAVMDRAAAVPGVVLAATHGGFVRAAIAQLLDAPARSAWVLAIPPASVTVLTAVTGDPSTWQVRAMGWQPALVAA